MRGSGAFFLGGASERENEGKIFEGTSERVLEGEKEKKELGG